MADEDDDLPVSLDNLEFLLLTEPSGTPLRSSSTRPAELDYKTGYDLIELWIQVTTNRRTTNKQKHEHEKEHKCKRGLLG